MGRRRRYDPIEPYRPPENVVDARSATSGQATGEAPRLHARTDPAPARSHARSEPDPPTAEAAPLDVNGVAVTTAGTILWALAFFALLPFRSNLDDHGAGWWLWTCVAGFGLGLWGIYYCRRRRDRLARAQSSS